jgi:GT2 family glycosyltransferase
MMQAALPDARAGKRPRVSVIIPSWNGRELLEVCLPSLARQTFRDFEVIVVDNGSDDGTADWLASAYDEVRIVAFAENRGFAAAANGGIRAASGNIIVLLNNDTETDRGWLAALVRALDENHAAGFCASRVLNYYHRELIDSAGDKFGPLASQIGHGVPDGPWFDEPRSVLSACAAAAAYRREMLDEIGLFDEEFISYLEDVDLGLRAQYAGYSCIYVPDAIVYHMVSATARRISATKQRLLLRNSLFIFFQYMPPRTVLLWSGAMLAFPYVFALRRWESPRVATQALAGFLRCAGTVWRKRRTVRRRRAITDQALRKVLSPPFGHAAVPIGLRSSARTGTSLRRVQE